MDWDKFNYSTIGDNILDRFFNEGHGIKTVGDINDFLNLPKVFDDEKDLKGIGVEETKNEDDKNDEVKNEDKKD